MILLRILAFQFLNSRVHMNEYLLDGLKNYSLENITCSEMGKQTAKLKKSIGAGHKKQMNGKPREYQLRTNTDIRLCVIKKCYWSQLPRTFWKIQWGFSRAIRNLTLQNVPHFCWGHATNKITAFATTSHP